MKTYQPIGNRVVVEVTKPAEKTKSGIMLTDDQEVKTEGIIIAVGDGPELSKTALKVGSRVLFGQYAGDELKEIDGRMLSILPLDDILAIINEQ